MQPMGHGKLGLSITIEIDQPLGLGKSVNSYVSIAELLFVPAADRVRVLIQTIDLLTPPSSYN